MFAFTMLLGMQSVTAQNNSEKVNAEAIEKTEALKKVVQFNSEQTDRVYLAIKEYTKVKMSSASKASVMKAKSNLERQMKTILTEEQYERYRTFAEE